MLGWGLFCPQTGCHLRSAVSPWPYRPCLQSGDRKVTDLWSHGAGVRHRWTMDVEMFAKGFREGLLFHARPLSLLFFKEALLSMVHKGQSSFQHMGHRGDQFLSSPSLASKETGFLPASQGWGFCRHPPLADEPVVFGFHISASDLKGSHWGAQHSTGPWQLWVSGVNKQGAQYPPLFGELEVFRQMQD